MLHGLFLQIATQLLHLGLSLLVELNLGGCLTTLLIKGLGQFFQFPGEVVFRFLGLSPGLPFSLELFFEFFNAGLEIPDLFLELSYKALLLFQFLAQVLNLGLLSVAQKNSIISCLYLMKHYVEIRPCLYFICQK
ncbi:hypothetical protein DPMN_182669 [Dreissena polymorpha]|uniref:Uncharacterized protein n=1 Tax=Dreissena polymorpha TaxID=45954 RepID=A0A9D4DG42_DREPO|nr:hypothetical protein DPMN_182669 [Dreissena polymorpha]